MSVTIAASIVIHLPVVLSHEPQHLLCAYRRYNEFSSTPAQHSIESSIVGLVGVAQPVVDSAE